MNIHAAIIDQRIVGVMEDIRQQAKDELNIHDDERLKSLAFLYLCVKTVLDLDAGEAFDCLTEGGADFGVDGIHLGEKVDGEFFVVLFQSKYNRNLDSRSTFDGSGIDAMINAIRYIFDPSAELGNINHRLKTKVEEIRSLVRDGFIPRVRAIPCNNGLRWNDTAQQAIERAEFGNQVTWEHVNHDTLVRILQNTQPVHDILRLAGKAIVEDMNFSRVCIGRIPVTEIATLMKTHGERLLERNVRRYLGLHDNRVNEGIRSTLLSQNPTNFYFFNNGLTLICSDFSYNALQNSDFQVHTDNLQIVNGGQTCMTIFKTLEEMQTHGRELSPHVTVLVRIYKLPKDDQDLVLQITHATNSQNPVDLKDLRSNHEKQQQLEASIQALGYSYRRKRMEQAPKIHEITSGVAAEAILSVWRQAPHQAKFLLREHFGKLYDKIFSSDLNGVQTVVAVLLYRIAENHRRRPETSDPTHVQYSSCFTAMQMGRYLLKDLRVNLSKLDHRNFAQAQELVQKQGETYFQQAAQDVDTVLGDLYGHQDISMQQLSATFRRGDLVERLLKLPV